MFINIICMQRLNNIIYNNFNKKSKNQEQEQKELIQDDNFLINRGKEAVVAAKSCNIIPLLDLVKNPNFHIKHLKQLNLSNQDGYEIMKGVVYSGASHTFIYALLSDNEIFNFFSQGKIFSKESF